MVVFSMRIRAAGDARSALASTSSTAERALEAEDGPALHELAALLQGGDDRNGPPSLRSMWKNPGEAPRLEAPAEHRLVEAAGGVDVVGVDGEVSERCTHGHRSTPVRSLRTVDVATESVAGATATCQATGEPAVLAATP
jgi:hypothetical protein